MRFEVQEGFRAPWLAKNPRQVIQATIEKEMYNAQMGSRVCVAAQVRFVFSSSLHQDSDSYLCRGSYCGPCNIHFTLFPLCIATPSSDDGH